VRGDRRAFRLRRNPSGERRDGRGDVGVRRSPLVLARRSRAPRRARRRARGRGPHHDRKGLGTPAEAAPSAPPALRAERPARGPDRRGRLAAGLRARVPVKIAVHLPTWLGDTVMAVPAIRALRETFPDAPVLLAGPWVALLAGQGLADALVAYPRNWTARLRAADAVRSFASDTVVLLPNSFESAATAMYWRARRRVGYAGDARRRRPLPPPARPPAAGAAPPPGRRVPVPRRRPRRAREGARPAPDAARAVRRPEAARARSPAAERSAGRQADGRRAPGR